MHTGAVKLAQELSGRRRSTTILTESGRFSSKCLRFRTPGSVMHDMASRQAMIALMKRCEDEWVHSTPAHLDRYIADLSGRDDFRRLALLRLARLALKRAAPQNLYVDGSRVDATFLLSRYPQLTKPPEAALDLYGYEFHLRKLDAERTLSRQWSAAPRRSLLTWAQYLESVPRDVREKLKQPSRYSRLSVLGAGGFGRVWLARDEELGRDVALKELKLPANEDSLRDEARLTGELEHPAIVPIFGLAKTTDGRTSYVMRCVTWEPLTARIKAFRTKPSRSDHDRYLRELLRHLITACEAIEFAHDRHVLHLDIKPDNILVGEYVSETMVMDWGLARIAVSHDKDTEAAHQSECFNPEETARLAEGRTSFHAAPTVTGDAITHSFDWGRRQAGSSAKVPTSDADMLAMYPHSILKKRRLEENFFGGTPGYMSPEQVEGRPGKGADIHALGATLYQILTGLAPYPSLEDQEPVSEYRQRVLVWKVSPPRSRDRSVPKPLDAICMKSLAVDLDQRYSSPLELAADVENWLANRRVMAYDESLPEKTWRLIRNNPKSALISSAALLAVILITVGAIIATRQAAHNAKVARSIEALPATEARDAPDAIRSLWKEPTAFRLIRHRLDDAVGTPKIDDSKQFSLSPVGELRLRLVLVAADESEFAAFVRGLERWLDVEPLEVFTWSELVSEQVHLLPSDQVDDLQNDLWEIARSHRSPAKRLKAAVALARLAPNDERWQPRTVRHDIRPDTVHLMVNSDATVLGLWTDGLRPIRKKLIRLLKETANDPQRTSQERDYAVGILADYLIQDGKLREMIEALEVATPRQHQILTDRLASIPDRDPIDLILRRLSTRDSSEYHGHANLAAAILRLAPKRFDWSLLAPKISRPRNHESDTCTELGHDPRLATRLLHLIPEVKVEARTLLDKLRSDELHSPSVIRTVILCLGLYASDRLPTDVTGTLVEFCQHRDPGVHAAARWSFNRHRSSAIAQFESDVSNGGDSSRQWRMVEVPGGNCTMVRIPRPPNGKFLMGASSVEIEDFPNPDDVDNLWTQQTQRCMRIDHDYEIASTEVTTGQLEAYIAAAQEDAELAFVGDLHQAWAEGKTYRPNTVSPANNVTWDEACAYCNWLSADQELKPCYELDETGHVNKIFLANPGYRLPTEAEWEWACRAGTRTLRYYGDNSELLPFYANYILNSWRQPQAVGQRIPNDWGLFDMQGNVFEWCDVAPATKTPDILGIRLRGARDTKQNYLARGASFKSNPEVVRSAYRYAFAHRRFIVGFRIARTLPAPAEGK